MSRIEGIALAFPVFRKAAHAAIAAHPGKFVLPSRQYFMGIGLMTDIPDNLILRQIQTEMQRHRQLHNPEIRGQMAARFAHRVDNKVPELCSQLIIPGRIYILNIIRLFNLL